VFTVIIVVVIISRCCVLVRCPYHNNNNDMLMTKSWLQQKTPATEDPIIKCRHNKSSNSASKKPTSDSDLLPFLFDG